MIKENIDPKVEEEKLKRCRMFSNRGFMATVRKRDGTVLFYPHMISNFSIDNNKIFITVYDIIQKMNIEEELDSLLKGFWIFKEKVTITLSKLDPTNKEVYCINYSGCRLNKYHGKKFTYKANDSHQWYLEFTFKSKNYKKNKLYTFDGKEVTHNITQEGVKKETAVINSSNKMLDEAADKVQSTYKLPQSQKDKKIIEDHNAIVENKQTIKKYYGNNLQKLDFNEIEKALENQIAKLENKSINR